MRRLSRVACSSASRRSRASSAESSPRSIWRMVWSSASRARGILRPTRLERMRSRVSVTTRLPRRRGGARRHRETRERPMSDAASVRLEGGGRRSPAVGRVDPALVAPLQDGVAGDEPAVLEDPDLLGVALDLDDALPRGVGDRVEVAAHQDHALVADAPLDGEHGAVGDGRVRDQRRPFLGKVLVDHAPGGGVDAGVRDRAPPVVELAVEVGHGEPWSRHRSEAHGERRAGPGRSPAGRSGRAAPPCPWSWRGTGGRRGGSRRSGSGARRARCCR